MSVLEENDQVRAAEYALGLLEAQDARAFEVEMDQRPDVRAVYAEWCEMLADLSVDSVTPPSHVQTAVQSRLFGAAPSVWQRFGKFFVGLGTVCAALILVGYMTVQPPNVDYTANVTADQSMTFQADVIADSRVLRVAALITEPPASRAHELWIIPTDGTPISLGILTEGQVAIPGGFDLNGALLAVTVEAPEGSPTGQPTTTPIAAAPLVEPAEI